MKQLLKSTDCLYIEDDSGNSVTIPTGDISKYVTEVPDALMAALQVTYEPDRNIHCIFNGKDTEVLPIPDQPYEDMISQIAAINTNMANPLYGLTGHALDDAKAKLQADRLRDYEWAVQVAMDSLAQAWGYDTIASAISYVNSTVAKWKNEGAVLNQWRDTVWTWAADQRAAILADPSTAPATAADFVAEMPAAPARPTA